MVIHPLQRASVVKELGVKVTVPLGSEVQPRGAEFRCRVCRRASGNIESESLFWAGGGEGREGTLASLPSVRG